MVLGITLKLWSTLTKKVLRRTWKRQDNLHSFRIFLCRCLSSFNWWYLWNLCLRCYQQAQPENLAAFVPTCLSSCTEATILELCSRSRVPFGLRGWERHRVPEFPPSFHRILRLEAWGVSAAVKAPLVSMFIFQLIAISTSLKNSVTTYQRWYQGRFSLVITI